VENRRDRTANDFYLIKYFDKMKKIRILNIVFDNVIEPYQLSNFRSSIIQSVGIEHDLFHNHKKNDTYNYRYPLIQYKLFSLHDKIHPIIFCIEEGIEEINFLFDNTNLTLKIGNAVENLIVQSVNVKVHNIQVWENNFNYHIHKWQALNPKSYQRYITLESEDEKILFLEKNMLKHLYTLLNNFGISLKKKIFLKIKKIKNLSWISYKGTKILTFSIDFETNISLPEFIGVGKGISLGFGVIRQR
jgi:hypothetical protein